MPILPVLIGEANSDRLDPIFTVQLVLLALRNRPEVTYTAVSDSTSYPAPIPRWHRIFPLTAQREPRQSMIRLSCGRLFGRPRVTFATARPGDEAFASQPVAAVTGASIGGDRRWCHTWRIAVITGSGGGLIGNDGQPQPALLGVAESRSRCPR